MTNLVQNISDTARWVAVFRADESERPDAVFRDPYARRLAGEKGKQIADRITFSRQNYWIFVARTFLFDKIIQEQVSKGCDMVINLAAGLDTRPYRMPLPRHIHWIEVDLPGILEYKESILANEKPVCSLERIKMDLAARDERVKLFNRLAKSTSKALVVTEGLIIYLERQDAAALSEDLSAQSEFTHWVFDLASPAVLEMARKEMEPGLEEGHVVFKFGPEEGEDFFEAHGWKSLESHSQFRTAAALNRLPPEMVPYAEMPEAPGPRRSFPWSGVCLFENKNKRISPAESNS